MPQGRVLHARLTSALAWASLLHVWNDGLTAALTALLPFVARDLHLDYARAALLRSAHIAALSGAQIPLAGLAATVGDTAVLGAGLVWFGTAIILFGSAATFALALLWGALAGAGAGAFHPIGTHQISAMADPRSRGRALGVLNFAGDVGKFAFPAAAGAVAAFAGWRASLVTVGGSAAVLGVIYMRARGRAGAGTPPRNTRHAGDPRPDGEPGPARTAGGTAHRLGVRDPWPFAVMSIIAVLDQAGRAVAMTFLPFLLVARGFGEAAVGVMFTLLLVGGGIGKLICGWLTDAVGERPVIVVTEIAMAAGLIGLLGVRGHAALAGYLVLLGVLVNGTSSALNTGVAAFVDSARGSRAYGIYFTCTFASSALAPAIGGMIANRSGLDAVFVAFALGTLLVPPMTFLLPRKTPTTDAAGRR